MLEESLERTFAADPYAQMGGFMKRCRGVDLYLKVENPPHHRIQRVLIAGQALEPDTYYTAAFVTEQGVPKKFGRNRKQLPVSVIDVLESYLKQRSTILR